MHRPIYTLNTGACMMVGYTIFDTTLSYYATTPGTEVCVRTSHCGWSPHFAYFRPRNEPYFEMFSLRHNNSNNGIGHTGRGRAAREMCGTGGVKWKTTCTRSRRKHSRNGCARVLMLLRMCAHTCMMCVFVCE